MTRPRKHRVPDSIRLTPCIVTGMLIVLMATTIRSQEPVHAESRTIGALPIRFVENRGVYPDKVAYFVRGVDRTVFFSPDGVTFVLRDGTRSWTTKLEFPGARTETVIRGEAPTSARISHFVGSPNAWRTGLRTCARIVFEDLWPGIDLVYRGDVGRLKYEFVVQPGADPACIRLRYRGADRVRIATDGALVVETPCGALRDAAPVAYQVIDGTRRTIAAAWSRPESDGRESLGFRLGAHDPTIPLVVDPAVLVYCGFIGGTAQEVGRAIAVDATGHAYIAGMTWSQPTRFPVKVGPGLTLSGGVWDAFIAKVKPDGSGLVYCGYIGGDRDDRALGVAVDAKGNAYVAGRTDSRESTFPVTGGPDRTYNGGGADAFVAKIDPTGAKLVYCGYLGGDQEDAAEAIRVDASGHVHVAGWTESTESTFPVKTGPDLRFNGSADAFVAKVKPDGSGLVYCGYVGGIGRDAAHGLGLDRAGRAVVAGETTSDQTTFPATVGPDLTFNGLAGVDTDAFVARVDATGSGLEYCGYIGGDQPDHALAIDVDAAGRAYVAGWTWSRNPHFPVVLGPDLTANGGPDGFVSRVNAAGTALEYCGYLGGARADRVRAVSVDPGNRCVVAGATFSAHSTFPVRRGPDLTFNAPYLDSDAFVGRVSSDGASLDYCGYVGGYLADDAFAVGVGPSGDAFVTGWTVSDPTSFPVVVGPSRIQQGNFDTFVARVAVTGLGATGPMRPGGFVRFSLNSPGDAGLPYQTASSFGRGPIAIDHRVLDLSPDGLFLLSIGNGQPAIFGSYRGRLDARGTATATLFIPAVSALIGTSVHTAFITLSGTAPSGVKTIADTLTIQVQP